MGDRQRHPRLLFRRRHCSSIAARADRARPAAGRGGRGHPRHRRRVDPSGRGARVAAEEELGARAAGAARRCATCRCRSRSTRCKPQVMRVALRTRARDDQRRQRAASARCAGGGARLGLRAVPDAHAGRAATMQAAPHYDDVVAEVKAFLAQRVAACEAAGIAPRAAGDRPGLRLRQDAGAQPRAAARAARVGESWACRCWRASRANRRWVRSPAAAVEERLAASVTAALLAVERGAAIVRVHDVAATRDALLVLQAVLRDIERAANREGPLWRMSRKYFGTDGVRGKVGELADHAGAGDAPGLRRGQGARRRGPPTAGQRAARGPDRQGHAHLRLHAGVRAAGRAVRRGGRHLPVRPDADAGGGLSHPRAAPVGRHRHQRLAQPVRGQRHQVLLRSRRQAARRDRAGDRDAPRRPDRHRAIRAARQGAPAQRRGRPLHRVLQEHLSQPTSICAA